MMELLEIEPAIVAHDLHPDFHSTRRAADFAREHGATAVAVQHHHAHVAAVAAEHGVRGPLLGLALDGVGLGTDGGTWGGELLRVDGAHCERLGHLAEIALPGGDRAAREPWRMGVAALHRLGRAAEAAQRFPGRDARALVEMLDRGVRCPPTSSMGRWFDAAAALAGVREVAAFEGQAAMLLEGLAAAHGPVDPLADGFRLADGELDFGPLLAAVADHCAAPAAALFHATVAAGLARWTTDAARGQGLRRVALGGGCFMNHVLATDLRARLERAGLEVLEAEQAPPNDGGVALGQAWVAIRAAQTG
jgi:hydrogenase maturation protein HypF